MNRPLTLDRLARFRRKGNLYRSQVLNKREKIVQDVLALRRATESSNVVYSLNRDTSVLLEDEKGKLDLNGVEDHDPKEEILVLVYDDEDVYDLRLLFDESGRSV